MPTNRGGKMRGWGVTLWTSTSLSIANRLRKKVGDRSSRRFTTTAVHQIGGSPANAVDGEKRKLGAAGLVFCILILIPQRLQGIHEPRFVDEFILLYVSYKHTP